MATLGRGVQRRCSVVEDGRMGNELRWGGVWRQGSESRGHGCVETKEVPLTLLWPRRSIA